MPATKPKHVWIVLEKGGIAFVTPYRDAKGDPILKKNGKPRVTQRSVDAGVPFVCSSDQAERLVSRGHARKAKTKDFDPFELDLDKDGNRTVIPEPLAENAVI